MDPRIVGIIHKATQGQTFEDPKYQSRHAEAIAAGYLWGAYHLGTRGHIKEQVEYFLHFAKLSSSELIALDLEERPDGMTLQEAVEFARLINKKTGRYPLIYGGKRILNQKLSANGVAILNKCKLWIVSTRDNPDGWPKSVWSHYTLWQFSSELRRRFSLSSANPKLPIDPDMDVNFFPDTQSTLRRDWPLSK